MITYLDTVEGVWFPLGGMHEVALDRDELEPRLTDLMLTWAREAGHPAGNR